VSKPLTPPPPPSNVCVHSYTRRKPISFLNNAHFEALLANNQLDDDLARRITAYSVVAKGSA